MKRILLFIGFFSCLAIAGTAQGLNRDNPKAGSRLEALKIAFLTRKLDLSSEEAQRFWPVYNKYSGEIRDVRNSQRDNPSSELEAEEKILKIRKKYNSEFTKALNAEKANTFFMAEKDFANIVVKEMNERREERKNRRQN